MHKHELSSITNNYDLGFVIELKVRNKRKFHTPAKKLVGQAGAKNTKGKNYYLLYFLNFFFLAFLAALREV